MDSKKQVFLKRRRNLFGKKIRKEYEAGKVKARMKDIREWATIPQATANTLSGIQIDNLIVCGQTTTTSMPVKSTAKTLEAKSLLKPTSKQSTLTQSPTTRFSLRDFLAKLSRLRVKGKVSRILVERYSTILPELSKLKDPSYYCLKTLKAYFRRKLLQRTILRSKVLEDTSLQESWNRWRNWGILSNGRCLTANISVFPKTAKECSLSDILEAQVANKYFLSESALKHIAKKINRKDGIGWKPYLVYAEEQDKDMMQKLA